MRHLQMLPVNASRATLRLAALLLFVALCGVRLTESSLASSPAIPPSDDTRAAAGHAGGRVLARLELLRQLVPKATTIGVLVNPNTDETETERRDVQAAAQAIGQQLIILDFTNIRDLGAAFATFVQRGAGALLIGSGPIVSSHRTQIIALAARHALPASYILREYV